MPKLTRIAVAAVIGIAAIVAVVSLSSRPTEARVPPGPKCECANLDAPVICTGGKVYPNPCVANCFKATGCVPYGG